MTRIRYLLDTNAVSSIMKNEPAMIARLRTEVPEEIGLPQPVLAELSYGIERLVRSKRRTLLEGQLARIRGVFQRVAWTDDVSARFGELNAHLERSGQRVEDFDVAIAAHALSIDATLVTANTKHMARIVGLRLESW